MIRFIIHPVLTTIFLVFICSALLVMAVATTHTSITIRQIRGDVASIDEQALTLVSSSPVNHQDLTNRLNSILLRQNNGSPASEIDINDRPKEQNSDAKTTL